MEQHPCCIVPSPGDVNKIQWDMGKEAEGTGQAVSPRPCPWW